MSRPAPSNDAAWTALTGKTFSNLTDDERTLIHFHDDYIKLKSIGDSDYASLSDEFKDHHPNPNIDPNYEVIPGSGPGEDDGLWYTVDAYRDYNNPDLAPDDHVYFGAQPLRDVFEGLKGTLERFRERRVAGDKACLIFFNGNFGYPKIINLTDVNDPYLDKFIEFGVESGLSSDPSGVDVVSELAASSGFEHLVRHGIVPGGIDASLTNTILALREAMNQLDSGNPGGFSADFVVSIGDGQTNCTCNIDPNTGACTAPYTCQNRFSQFWKANDPSSRTSSELLNFVRHAYAGRSIPIHWIQVGRNTAPHTRDHTLAPGPDGTQGPCITDAEARAEGVEMVTQLDADLRSQHEAEFLNQSPSSPFYAANYVPYQIATLTGGIWGPLREMHADCGGVEGAGPALCIKNQATFVPLTGDPQCRSRIAQLNQYTDDILGENPFAIVQVTEGK